MGVFWQAHEALDGDFRRVIYEQGAVIVINRSKIIHGHRVLITDDTSSSVAATFMGFAEALS